MPGSTLPTLAAAPIEPLTDAEISRLSAWIAHTALPAWRRFDPAMPDTPVDTIRRLIVERHALRAVVELLDESAVLQRGLLAHVIRKEENEHGRQGG
jgi:hypothetical protein